MKSNKFRIAKEGATTDGRNIPREWLEQMAENYSPKKYGARLNLEHYRGMIPDSYFKAYGDVIALSTEEENGELYLLADIDPTEACIEMNKQRQKIYTSMEVDPDFAKTGEAYLVGLALTDSPASLGTEMLQFSKIADANPFASRKTRPENLFSESFETAIEFTDVEEKTSVIDRVKTMFAKQTDRVTTDLNETVIVALDEFNKGLQGEYSTKTELQAALEKFENLESQYNQLQTAHDELVQRLSTESDTHQRPPATGGDNQALTNC